MRTVLYPLAIVLSLVVPLAGALWASGALSPEPTPAPIASPTLAACPPVGAAVPCDTPPATAPAVTPEPTPADLTWPLATAPADAITGQVTVRTVTEHAISFGPRFGPKRVYLTMRLTSADPDIRIRSRHTPESMSIMCSPDWPAGTVVDVELHWVDGTVLAQYIPRGIPDESGSLSLHTQDEVALDLILAGTGFEILTAAGVQ